MMTKRRTYGSNDSGHERRGERLERASARRLRNPGVGCLALALLWGCSGPSEELDAGEAVATTAEPLTQFRGGRPTADPFFEPDVDADVYPRRDDGLPLLHSNPNADAVIYLDYDGDVAEGFPDDNHDWLPMDFEHLGSSNTLNKLETGDKEFTVNEAHLNYAGARVRARPHAPADEDVHHALVWMEGNVVSHVGQTLRVRMNDVRGTAGKEYTEWRLHNVSAPLNYDNDERQIIFEAWRQVSAWFAPFNVDVTTDPAVATEDRPINWLVVHDNQQGGQQRQSIFKTFPHARATARASQAMDFYPGLVHELTHNFGVGVDMTHKGAYDDLGVLMAAYGPSDSGVWSRIMGGGEGLKIPKFSAWYTDAGITTWQAEIAEIQTSMFNAGVTPFRTSEPDQSTDHGNTRQTATDLTSFGGHDFGARGILVPATDIDYFRFKPTKSGMYAITVAHDGPSTVDTAIVIHDNAGAMLAARDGSTKHMLPDVPDTNPYDSHITRYFDAGTYTIGVGTHGNYADIGQYSVRASYVGAAENPWLDTDVGFVGVAGHSTYNSSNGTFTISGSGATEDEFHFLTQRLNGSGLIRARITDLVGSNGWSRAGIMIRQSLDPASDYVSLSVTREHGWLLQARSSGVAAVNYEGNGIAFDPGDPNHPKYIEIDRSGDTFGFWVSSTGAADDWTEVLPSNGTRLSAPMTGDVYIGLFVMDESGGWIEPPVRLARRRAWERNYLSDQRLTDAKFRSVAIETTPLLGPGVLNPGWQENTSLGVPTLNAPTAVTGDSVSLSWSPTTLSGYWLEYSSDGVHYDAVSVSGTSKTVGGLNDAEAYFFRVRGKGSGSNVSRPSAVRAAVTRPGVASTIQRRPTYMPDTLAPAVALDWTDATGESGYVIYRSTSQNSGYSQVGTASRNQPHFLDTGSLSLNTTYWYKIETTDAAGTSATTAPFSVRTRTNDTVALPPTLTNPSGRTVRVKWSAVLGASGYRVYTSGDGGNWRELATTTTATYDDTNVRYTRYYKVVPFRNLTVVNPGQPSRAYGFESPSASITLP
jgi:hypothetical protein